MNRNPVLAAVAVAGMMGAYALAQSPAPEAQMGGGMKGMMDMKGKASPEMGAMMEKMSPEMKMRCQMLMNTTVVPGDPAAILSLKGQLKLTDAQTTQLEAINKEAQTKAAAVLTVDQLKTVDALPRTPQTMMDMHERMMGQMQKMGGTMGEQMMSCPMMSMTHAATQPPKDKPATPENHAQHQ